MLSDVNVFGRLFSLLINTTNGNCKKNHSAKILFRLGKEPCHKRLYIIPYLTHCPAKAKRTIPRVPLTRVSSLYSLIVSILCQPEAQENINQLIRLTVKLSLCWLNCLLGHSVRARRTEGIGRQTHTHKSKGGFNKGKQTTNKHGKQKLQHRNYKP